MNALSDLQRVAQRHLLDGGPLPGPLVEALVPAALERWEIYTEAYRLRLVEALATTYGALAARLGREAFAALAREFIDRHPSVHRSLRDYGSEFGAFIAQRGSDAELRLQAELATFEWRLAAAFDAEDVTPTTVDDLGAIAPEAWPTLAFRAVPALGRVQTTTNAIGAWRALREALDAEAAAAGPIGTPVAEVVGTVEWLIARPQLESRFRSLPPDEAQALDQVLAGMPFAALCETLVAAHGDGAARVAATWLKGWLTEGILLRV